jgi:hypothetical protein
MTSTLESGGKFRIPGRRLLPTLFEVIWGAQCIVLSENLVEMAIFGGL